MQSHALLYEPLDLLLVVSHRATLLCSISPTSLLVSLGMYRLRYTPHPEMHYGGGGG